MGEFRQSAESMAAFYASLRGRAAARVIHERIAALWSHVEGEHVLGIGGPPDMLAGIGQRAASLSVVDTRARRPDPHDGRGRGNTVLAAHPTRLPFADQSFSRVVAMHELEEAESPHGFLRELWRVTREEGRIILVVANRRGLWSRAEHTPFGHGTPYTRRQLWTLVGEALFQPSAWAHALYVPPITWPVVAGAAQAWEKAGEVFWPGLGGVVMVEAVKRLVITPGSAAATVTRPVSKPVRLHPPAQRENRRAADNPQEAED